ncbi:cysteine dioxygenase family protein [Trinickia acidisoli]|uniref:cysteine dioxygenase family protein n=1 Tax=Trinickia acidisoli TaxID=2767482 RepID=UPI001A8E6A2C|nr:cysteine dioxygenase family protein [Trinickia acidisoli]
MTHNFESVSLDPAHAAAPLHTHEHAATRTIATLDAAASAVDRLRDAFDEAFAAVPRGLDPARSPCPEFARLMRAALAQAAAEDDLLTPAQREGAASSYRRHLLIADPRDRYTVAALVWQPGQASPVHGHHTWCGYAVLDGVLHETLYGWSEAADRAAPMRTQAREAGAVSYVRAGLSAIHRLANGGTRPAVSLHVYGVPSERITTHVNRLVPTDLESAASAGRH